MNMKKFLSVLFFGWAAFPLITFAQAGGLVPCSGPDCTTAHVSAFANGLIAWLISMLGVIAVIMLVYAGFRMVVSRGDVGEWGKAKEMFTNVIIGIIIILAAWLVIDTILKGLTNRGLNDWTDELNVQNPNPSALTSGRNTSPNSVSAGQYTDAEARSALSAAGITVWESAPGRTRFDNINQATINEAVRIRQACGCAVVVTGGTESGHAGGTYSHASGYKIDLDDSPALNNYITSNYTRSGTRSDGAARYIAPNGAEYYREGHHWDVLVQ